MKKLIVEIAAILVLLYVARSITLGVVNVRMMNHMNECHAELDVAHRINGPRGPQRDELFRKYEQCTLDKGTFVDNFFVGDSIHTVMEELKK